MLRVALRGSGVPQVVLGSGETLLVGRAPQAAVPVDDPAAQLRQTTLALPRCAPHVSRLLGELVVGAEMVRLCWRGGSEAQLSSLFEAPGGARRATLTEGMSALLDEGENHLQVLRGRQLGPDTYVDLLLVVDVATTGPAEPAPAPDPARPDGAAAQPDRDAAPTGPAPGLTPGDREWYVALALAEPWLTGADDYPRPPSNREIYERVLGWHGYAWNLEAPQRVDDAIRTIALVAFGRHDNPFRPSARRVQNVRFAVGRRAAEVRLVTAADLAVVERQVSARQRPPPAS
ncbi:MAG TPA: hypothetical protein VMU51_13630 [Mycobacteriales bacterium]|nr:hypothetical protein [Mycobacteriales bacterium]